MKSINFILSCILLILFILLDIRCGKSEYPGSKKEVTLLNVSYDPTRELYREFNKAFIRYWRKETGNNLTINQSHGGSGKQARSVIDGLEADVVTLALAYDIEEISNQGKLIDVGWQNEFPYNSSPYNSTIVFLVRKGNPKKIKDWEDLTRIGISVITPNPKTSGGARWNYLAAWAFASRKFGRDQDKIKNFMHKLLKNVPVFDTGARGSANTFVQRETGDVLISWENEAILIVEEVNKNKYELVYPSLSILAQPPVAVVDKIVDKKGTREEAEAYIKYLFSEEGQEIIAHHYYRPINIVILNKYRYMFPYFELTTIDREFDGWQNAQRIHFKDGGVFDQIFEEIQKK